MTGHADIANILISAGSNIDAQDKVGLWLLCDLIPSYLILDRFFTDWLPTLGDCSGSSDSKISEIHWLKFGFCLLAVAFATGVYKFWFCFLHFSILLVVFGYHFLMNFYIQQQLLL